MSTLSEIGKIIQEVRILLQTSLNPDFFNAIKNTIQLINSLLSDPSISENVKGSLEQLNKFLKEANDKGSIDEINKLTKEIREKLSELDIPTANNILKNVNKSLEQTQNAQFIDHMVDGLKAAKSLGEFAELAKTFMEKSTNVLIKYGPYAAVVGTTLKVLLGEYVSNKTEMESEIVKILRESNTYSAQTALATTELLRKAMFADLRKINKDLKNGLYDQDPELLKIMMDERDYDLFFIKTMQQLSKESLTSLSVVKYKLEKLLQHFAETEIKHESLEDYLDSIGKSHKQYWNELLNYIVYSHKTNPWGKPVKVKLSQYERNYRGICRLYGEEEVHAIMNGLTKNLAKNGGDELYYELANSMEDSAGMFLTLVQRASQNNSFSVHAQFFKPVVQLQTYFHEKAEEYIKEQWQKTKWLIGYQSISPELDDTTVQIIKARAFAEFCRNTSPYFFGLYPIPRELYNGVLDVPKGLWRTLNHPIDTVKGIGGLFTKKGLSNVGRSFLNHPIRIITPTLISGTCSYAASNLPTVFSSTAQATIPQLETLIDTGTISSTATISVTAAGISASESLSITGTLSLTATETSGVLSVQAATIISSTLAVPPIVSTPTPQINKNRFFSPTPSTSAESSRLEQSPRHNI